jgi:site-specific DNA-methyltransferase (adenine-specific)
MEYMRTLPDKAFELAIVDPPYGIGVDGQTERHDYKNPKHSRKGHIQKTWDDTIPPKAYFDELLRVSDNQIIWGANYFVAYLKDGHKGWIIWDKGQRGLTMSDCEIAYSSFDKPTRIFTLNRVALLQQGTIHPTEKPIQLYIWLMKNYAKPGDKILDTHLGSGSSRIAAYEMGFDFVGCEIDRDYFEAQEKRWEHHISQMRMEI